MRIIGLGLIALGGLMLGMTSHAGTEVRLETTQGTFTVELADEQAPETVANFLDYVRSDAYAGTIFHRIVPGFVIQGGGYTPDYQRVETDDPIRNEADNGLTNDRGTLAMARTRDPHSATNQFFINLKANTALDHRAKTPRGWGYTVFGRVIEGMDVIEAIAAVETGSQGPFRRNAPVEPVVIEAATVTDSVE